MSGECLWLETTRTGELGTTLEEREMELVGKQKDRFRVGAFHSRTHSQTPASKAPTFSRLDVLNKGKKRTVRIKQASAKVLSYSPKAGFEIVFVSSPRLVELPGRVLGSGAPLAL